jgi:2,3,4,5-tetrahydropyridine-2,6-dicarboxylate N-succinyltransferase
MLNPEIYEIKKTVISIMEKKIEVSPDKLLVIANQVVSLLEKNKLRVCAPAGANENCGSVEMRGDLRNWQVFSWVKFAILLAFRSRNSKELKSGDISYFDKFTVQEINSEKGIRAVPGAVLREGSYIEKGCILMPSFVNTGAWVGAGSMVDTWATVGSCAQVGKNVHLAGGVGIGGVLEPASARPVMIGDEAFIGSRAIVVEGAVVSHHAILGANVCLTASVPIYDLTIPAKTEYRGYIPPYAIVAPGTREKEFPGGKVQLACAYIIGYRSLETESKVSLNNALRESGIAV